MCNRNIYMGNYRFKNSALTGKMVRLGEVRLRYVTLGLTCDNGESAFNMCPVR